MCVCVRGVDRGSVRWGAVERRGEVMSIEGVGQGQRGNRMGVREKVKGMDG